MLFVLLIRPTLNKFLSYLTLVKMMERIIYNGLYEYREGNDFVTCKKFGFKKNYSTTNSLLDLNHKFIVH